MPRVSLIVPVYQVEEYLDRCVASILNQTLRDIEVFLATDGPEACDRICRDYAARDPRVRLILHPGGYGRACNQAMSMASGEYLGIVEADDWCHPRMFETLYEAARAAGADVCKAGFYLAFDDAAKNRPRLFHAAPESFSISRHPELLAFQPSLWSAIYKSSFLRQHAITMMEERMSFLDGPFHMETLLRAGVITNVAEPLYYYYQDNPKQSVRNQKASFDGLKAEEFFYAKIPLESIADEKLRSHVFRSTLARMSWSYTRLTDAAIQEEFKGALKRFFDSLPVQIVNKNCIEDSLWKTYEFFHGTRKKLPGQVWKKLAQTIFSIQKKGNIKMLTILGLKFRLTRKGGKETL